MYSGCERPAAVSSAWEDERASAAVGVRSSASEIVGRTVVFRGAGAADASGVAGLGELGRLELAAAVLLLSGALMVGGGQDVCGVERSDVECVVESA
jgi:hypothetical protein